MNEAKCAAILFKFIKLDHKRYAEPSIWAIWAYVNFPKQRLRQIYIPFCWIVFVCKGMGGKFSPVQNSSQLQWVIFPFIVTFQPERNKIQIRATKEKSNYFCLSSLWQRSIDKNYFPHLFLSIIDFNSSRPPRCCRRLFWSLPLSSLSHRMQPNMMAAPFEYTERETLLHRMCILYTNLH